jgi:hypothetical protein
MVKITPSVCGWIATTGFIGAHCAIALDTSPNTKTTERKARRKKAFLFRILRRPPGTSFALIGRLGTAKCSSLWGKSILAAWTLKGNLISRRDGAWAASHAAIGKVQETGVCRTVAGCRSTLKRVIANAIPPREVD